MSYRSAHSAYRTAGKTCPTGQPITTYRTAGKTLVLELLTWGSNILTVRGLLWTLQKHPTEILTQKVRGLSGSQRNEGFQYSHSKGSPVEMRGSNILTVRGPLYK